MWGKLKSSQLNLPDGSIKGQKYCTLTVLQGPQCGPVLISGFQDREPADDVSHKTRGTCKNDLPWVINGGATSCQSYMAGNRNLMYYTMAFSIVYLAFQWPLVHPGHPNATMLYVQQAAIILSQAHGNLLSIKASPAMAGTNVYHLVNRGTCARMICLG